MRRRFFNNNIEKFDINDYFTIEALEDNLQVYFPYEDLMYGIDGIGWQKLMAGAYTPSIRKGQTVSFKGNVKSIITDHKTFTITKRCNLLGNCMSLASSDTLGFYGLFYGCKTIVSVSNDFLPATTLADYCYRSMFEGCTSLTQAPALPATTLADYCYRSMFEGCTSLTQAPALPATTLADYCYRYMFSGCSSLTTPPELPATTLADSCYDSMFKGCTNLTQAPELPARTLTQNCYFWMFEDCTSLTTAPELPARRLAAGCYHGMFNGCTSLTTAPELPTNTLVSGCYDYMFYNCSKLNYIKAMLTTTPSTSYTSYWVQGVASTGTFVKNKNATWNVTATNSNSYIGVPYGWTVVNAITFTIGGTEYQAEEGMTWGEWVDSEYNTIGAFIYDNTKIAYSSIEGVLFIHTLDGYTVLPSDVILHVGTYKIAGHHAGGAD